MKKCILIIVATAFSITACNTNKKTDINADPRALELLEKMTIEEKIGQLCQFLSPGHLEISENSSEEDLANSDFNAVYKQLTNREILQLIKEGKIGSFLHVKTPEEANTLQSYAMQSRLKIPLLIATDAIHGHAMVDFNTTVFPAAIGMASTFDTALVRKEASIIAKEMRATGFHWNFYPNVDIGMDPRWGRIEETFGEDPGMVAMFGKAFTRGLQEKNSSGHITVAACAKHFIAGSRPYNGLNFAPEDISEREFRELWLPPFQSVLEVGAMTVMAAHHSLNSVPCHANQYILSEVLKEQLGFNGFVVSDWNDVERLHTIHRVAESREEASILAFNAGIDMNMHGPHFYHHILSAYNNGLINSERVDDAVLRILTVKYDLGLFDNCMVDISRIQSELLTDHNVETALEAARKSLVLMKNSKKILPLSPNEKKIFLAGPAANSQMMMGDWVLNYTDTKDFITIYDAFKARLKEDFLTYFETGNIWSISDKVISNCVQSARDADVIMLALGENSYRAWDVARSSGENKARANLILPGNQEKLIKELSELGKPIVLLLVSGRPLVLNGIEPNADAILNCWIPGMMGGVAITDVIFGDFNPQGKLPVTFPYTIGNSLNYYYSKPGARFRKYVDSPNEPLYPFGYGLSYSEFQYDSIVMQPDFNMGDSIKFDVYISNQGKYGGTETVLAFLSDLFSSIVTPEKRLIAFQKLYIQPNTQEKASFNLPVECLEILDINLNKVAEPGDFLLTIPNGDFSARLTAGFSVIDDMAINTGHQ
jgi:beta-glucosidase